jgi:tRNA A-37 threonylcarbamoyl transferase component Bud32
MMDCILEEAVKRKILHLCIEEVSPNTLLAASISDSSLYYTDKEKRIFNILLIVDSSRPILKYKVKQLKEGKIYLLKVDHKTFEKDIDKNWLGGHLVRHILVPYESLMNKKYLWKNEVKIKKRIVINLLNNLVLEYPELSYELLIKPKYFMFETMARNALLYPPVIYRLVRIFKDDINDINQKKVMKGYRSALKIVAEKKFITISDGYIKITSIFIKKVKKKRLSILYILKDFRDRIIRYSLEVFPKMIQSLTQDSRSYIEHFFDWENYKKINLSELENTKRHIYIPTPLGLVSLSEKVTIEEFVKRTFPNMHNLEVEKLGGVLNSVYILRFNYQKNERKMIVKLFKNWHSWKWFPLALWTLGSRGFAVLGKSRLEKEYTINMFLSRKDINVPRIIYANPQEGLIFEEFLDATSLSDIIKKICSQEVDGFDADLLFRLLGNEIAKVHKIDVALGDCKPENILVTQDKRIYFVDLEQAERGGDQSWDIAELLYFSGHYIAFSSIEIIKKITEMFIKGYLEGGGKVENIKKLKSPKYLKPFSFFTPPHILFVISSICKDFQKEKS